MSKNLRERPGEAGWIRYRIYKTVDVGESDGGYSELLGNVYQTHHTRHSEIIDAIKSLIQDDYEDPTVRFFSTPITSDGIHLIDFALEKAMIQLQKPRLPFP